MWDARNDPKLRFSLTSTHGAGAMCPRPGVVAHDWYNGGVMRWLRAALFVATAVAMAPGHASAQDPPPAIGPFAFDLHGVFARFPTADKQLSDSRGLDLQDLPGAGLGLHGGATVYPLRWKAVTFGFGADVTVARVHGAEKSVGELNGLLVFEA